MPETMFETTEIQDMATKKSRQAKVTTKATIQKAKRNLQKTSKKKMSALNAAAQVLQECKEPMSCPQLIEAMAAKGYWKSPGRSSYRPTNSCVSCGSGQGRTAPSPN